MAQETIRPGYTYKSGDTTTQYADNYVKLDGAATKLKIKNDSGNTIEFMINRAEDSDKVDGEVLPNEELDLTEMEQGMSSVAVKGSVASAFRFWAYY